MGLAACSCTSYFAHVAIVHSVRAWVSIGTSPSPLAAIDAEYVALAWQNVVTLVTFVHVAATHAMRHGHLLARHSRRRRLQCQALRIGLAAFSLLCHTVVHVVAVRPVGVGIIGVTPSPLVAVSAEYFVLA